MVLFACSPLTVFLSAVYTEAIFICLGVSAWLSGRNGRWFTAGVLAGLACTVRLNGIFLVIGLAALVVVRRESGKRHGNAFGATSLVLGPLVIAAWVVFLHHLTGHWNEWSLAQERGWNRYLTWPWVGIEDWWGKTHAADSWHLLLARLLEIAAVLLAPPITLYYFWRRNWPVAIMLGLNGMTVVFSSIFESGARFMLVWFPVYVTAAACLQRRPRLRFLLAAGSALLALTLSYSWSRHYWVA